MDRVIALGADVLGSHGMAAADYADLLVDLASGRLVLDHLVAEGGPLSLREAAEALATMGESPSTGIRVIDPTRTTGPASR